MSDLPRPPSEILADHTAIHQAISRAVRDAVLRSAQAGQPVATWQDGKVVWLPAEEVLARLSNGPTT
jgi:hypothetical protein